MPAGVHYVAAPVLVINLFAASPFNDIFYHVMTRSVDLMHKTSSASFGPNNWLMVRKTQHNKLLQEICHDVYRCPAGCNREKIH